MLWVDGGSDSASGSWPKEWEGDAIGASNYPRRGGKHLLYDGGVRVSALLHAPRLLPKSTRGTKYNQLMHAVDWFATYADLAGAKCNQCTPSGASASGKKWLKIDGVSHVGAMMGTSKKAPRTTIVLDNQVMLVLMLLVLLLLLPPLVLLLLPTQSLLLRRTSRSTSTG